MFYNSCKLKATKAPMSAILHDSTVLRPCKISNLFLVTGRSMPLLTFDIEQIQRQAQGHQFKMLL